MALNEAVSQGLVESCSAGHVRRSRSLSSKILTTRVSRSKFHLKICHGHWFCGTVQSVCYVTTIKWLTCLLQLMVTWYTGCPAMC